MSTRAVYGFADQYTDDQFWVYVHFDGYPTGAASYLQAFRDTTLRWPGGRYEADESAAAFVACNKESAGNVRLSNGPRGHGDIEFAYLLSTDDKGLWLRVYNSSALEESRSPNTLLDQIAPTWQGPLDDFLARPEAVQEICDAAY